MGAVLKLAQEMTSFYIVSPLKLVVPIDDNKDCQIRFGKKSRCLFTVDKCNFTQKSTFYLK